MNFEDIAKQIETMSLSDTLRIYLFINNKVDEMRKKDSQHISKMLYYVKNAEKVIERVKQNRKKH
jgi:hypothetical protein